MSLHRNLDYAAKLLHRVIWSYPLITALSDFFLIPFLEYDAFRQFRYIDLKAREEMLKAINAPLDVKEAQKIKSKNLRELTNTILESFTSGKISKEGALPVYQILIRENLVAGEDDFAEYLNEYKRH